MACQGVVESRTKRGLAQPRADAVEAALGREVRNHPIKRLTLSDQTLREPHCGQHHAESDDYRYDESRGTTAVDSAVEFDQRGMEQEGEQNRPRERHQERLENLVKLPG